MRVDTKEEQLYVRAANRLKEYGYRIIYQKTIRKSGDGFIEELTGIEVPLYAVTIDDHLKKIKEMFPAMEVEYDKNNFHIVIQ